jgi:uncharacterized repeat protein (TIGR03837 family)
MRYDVFCKVVDNYGDAAVCWRLARQLALEHGHAVVLWMDQPAALQALCPAVDAGLDRQRVDGVEVRRWRAGARHAAQEVAQVAIEAFGCGLPDEYAEQLASRPGGSLWVVLEYLSAESWVSTHHGLPSPHPRLAVARHYFFPGFAPGTGGVLCEADLAGRREAFQADPEAPAAFWRALGHAPPGAARTVSLFGYENPALAGLLGAWARGGRETVVAVPAGRIRPQVAAFLGGAAPADGACVRRGALELRFLPFLPQPRYDELLWACDWNFVRGEDSFVRAQWACRPLVWQIYPQAGEAHVVKLEAFLARYCTGLGAAPAAALAAFWRLWNAPQPPADRALEEAWRDMDGMQADLALHSRVWARELAGLGDMAGNLARFCRERLK